MSNIAIRQAFLQDLDLLLAWRMETLADVFGEDFAVLSAAEKDALAKANRDYYQQAIPAESHIAVFAEVGGEVAGCGGVCLQSEMPSPDNPGGACAYLMNIYTRPCYRGRGVAKAVVSHLIGEARKRGIARVYLETTDAARPLYQGLGFVDMVDYLKLGQTGTGCGETAC